MFKDFTIAALAYDGLLYLFELNDALKLLKDYPSDRKGWYFNEIRDRLCAEYESDNRVSINPAIVSYKLGLPVIE